MIQKHHKLIFPKNIITSVISHLDSGHFESLKQSQNHSTLSGNGKWPARFSFQFGIQNLEYMLEINEFLLQ